MAVRYAHYDDLTPKGDYLQYAYRKQTLVVDDVVQHDLF